MQIWIIACIGYFIHSTKPCYLLIRPRVWTLFSCISSVSILLEVFEIFYQN